jgi:PPP family 3-phenylpropionic acid transporter
MLKLFYACFFLTIGVSTPFFPAYLRQLGLSGQKVAVLLAIPPALQLVVPLGWGWLADRTRRPDLVLRTLCLGAFLASLPVIFARTMPALFVAYFVQQIFVVAIVGMADSVAVERWRKGKAYGPTRAAGSAAFMTACLAAGWWLDLRGLRPADALVPTLVSAGFAASFLAALGLRGRAVGDRPHARDVRRLLEDRRFRALLVVACLHWAALVPYHGFFGILLRERGLAARFTSFAFVIGTAAEIVLQLTHGLTFGLFWVTAMAWLAAAVPPTVRATGQMLFTMVNGIGAVTALLVTGTLYDVGGAALPFVLAGVLDLVAFAMVLAVARKGEPVPTVASAGS